MTITIMVLDTPLEVFMDVIEPLNIVLSAKPVVSHNILSQFILEGYLHQEELTDNCLIGEYISQPLITWITTEMEENVKSTSVKIH